VAPARKRFCDPRANVFVTDARSFCDPRANVFVTDARKRFVIDAHAFL
jgi:hypothetical protein